MPLFVWPSYGFNVQSSTRRQIRKQYEMTGSMSRKIKCITSSVFTQKHIHTSSTICKKAVLGGPVHIEWHYKEGIVLRLHAMHCLSTQYLHLHAYSRHQVKQILRLKRYIQWVVCLVDDNWNWYFCWPLSTFLGVHKDLFWQLPREGKLHGLDMSHATTTSSIPSFRASWTVGDAMVGR